MLQLDRYNTLTVPSRVPDVGTDLMAIKLNGCLDSSTSDRLLAVLELYRHQEISQEQAVSLSGLSQIEFSKLISSLI